jgi:hypothetical protein
VNSVTDEPPHPDYLVAHYRHDPVQRSSKRGRDGFPVEMVQPADRCSEFPMLRERSASLDVDDERFGGPGHQCRKAFSMLMTRMTRSLLSAGGCWCGFP